MLPRANQLFYVSLAVASLALVEGFVIFGGRIADEALELRRHTHDSLTAIGLSPQWYVGAYSIYTQKILPQVVAAFRPDFGLAQKAFGSLLKLVHLDTEVASPPTSPPRRASRQT